MAQDCTVSEGMRVLFVGSKFGIWKTVALRVDVRMNFLSGWKGKNGQLR